MKTRHRLILILSALALTAGILTTWHVPAQAVTIDGVTPSGEIHTVGVSDSGYLNVVADTNTAVHVVTDAPSVVNVTTVSTTVPIQGVAGGTAIQIQGIAGGTPVPVDATFSSTVTLTVVASSATTTANTATAVGTTAAACLSTAGLNVRQSIVCNADPSATIYLGQSNVTTSDGLPLPAGACMSPDNPSTFVGTLYAVSSATLAGLPCRSLLFKQ